MVRTMIIQIDIPDDSPELEELQYVVDQINTTRLADAQAQGHTPPPPLTVQDYVQPIVMAYFTKRVQNLYVAHARIQSADTLKEAFGPLSHIRGKKNGN